MQLRDAVRRQLGSVPEDRTLGHLMGVEVESGVLLVSEMILFLRETRFPGKCRHNNVSVHSNKILPK